MNIVRRVALAGAAAAMLVSAVPALAQDWLGGTPKKPIEDLKIGFSFRGGGGGNLYVVQYVEKLKKMYPGCVRKR